MSRQRNIEPLLLVIIDEDRRLFNVIGPMSDETSWNKRVCDAQDSGRQVSCFSLPASKTRELLIADVERDSKAAYTHEMLA